MLQELAAQIVLGCGMNFSIEGGGWLLPRVPVWLGAVESGLSLAPRGGRRAGKLLTRCWWQLLPFCGALAAQPLVPRRRLPLTLELTGPALGGAGDGEVVLELVEPTLEPLEGWVRGRTTS